MSNIFNSVKRAKVPRNFFNMSFDKKFTCDFGQIIPISCEEVLPTDKVKLGVEAVIRTEPLLTPLYHNVRVKFESFFVPCRLMMDTLGSVGDWESFITGGKNGDGKNEAGNVVSLPLLDTYWQNNSQPAKYSLWDYFGFPLGFSANSTNDPNKETLPVAFPWLAYNMVWNEYYRDENVDDKRSNLALSVALRRWTKDYFTSALPFRQRGGASGVPISALGSLNVPSDIPIITKGSKSDWSSIFGSSSGDSSGYILHSLANGTYSARATNPVFSRITGIGNSLLDPTVSPDDTSNNFGVAVVPKNSVKIPSVTAYNSQTEEYTYDNVYEAKGLDGLSVNVDAGGFTISDLRRAFQVQRFMERQAVGGARYIETLLSHFGYAPQDSRLQRPEFIGSFKGSILFSEIPQTSESGTTPQGTLRGKGAGAVSGSFGTYFVPEHGYILTLMTICPQNGYNSQGFDKKYLKRSKYDYYWPVFSHLSEEPILKREIYATGSVSNDTAEFGGYQGIYNEYRHNRNQVCADMRDDLSYWHLNRIFSSAPTLNSSFLMMDGTTESAKRAFAVQNKPAFICCVFMKQKMIRPLPLYPTPGLIDHF